MEIHTNNPVTASPGWKRQTRSCGRMGGWEDEKRWRGRYNNNELIDSSSFIHSYIHSILICSPDDKSGKKKS